MSPQTSTPEQPAADLQRPVLAEPLTDAQANTVYAHAYHLSQRGLHEEASGLFALLSLHRPEEAKYTLAVAICYRKLARYQDAIWMFARAMQLQPEDHGPAFQIVECMGLLGRPEEATDLLNRIAEAARLDGNGSTLRRAEALLQLQQATVQ